MTAPPAFRARASASVSTINFLIPAEVCAAAGRQGKHRYGPLPRATCQNRRLVSGCMRVACYHLLYGRGENGERFASLARVTTDRMRMTVAKLSSPDPDSRTLDYEGSRIEVIEGGWRILNYRLNRDRPRRWTAPRHRRCVPTERDNASKHPVRVAGTYNALPTFRVELPLVLDARCSKPRLSQLCERND